MELMTIKEVAEFLKTTAKTVNKWLYTGTLPRKELTFKIGAKVYFEKHKLMNFISTKQAS